MIMRSKAMVYVAAFATVVALSMSARSATTDTAGGQQFISKAAPGDWRASKLVGVAIYGQNNQSIGKVTDVIVDKSGAAKAVVIGVGGFLGVGQKNVALPFAAFDWSSEPIVVVTNAGPPPAGGAGSASPGSMVPAPAATSIPAPKGVYDYPDHGTVGLTKDQLKDAPDFHYASAATEE